MKVKPATTSGVVARATNQAVQKHQPQEHLIPGFGNISASDMVVPRLKLLQGLSPEVKDDPRRNIQGEWYHSILGGVLGESLTVVPLQIQRTIEMWAPRDDDRGLLARSIDGIHWDKPNEKFEVRIDGKKVIWDTKDNVGESGLAEFGTSKPGNPKSPPVAALTYRLALFLTEHEHLSPCLYIASRMATRGVQDLITRIQARHMAGVPFYGQQYQLAAVEITRGPNEFFSPAFKNAGNVEDTTTLAKLEALSKAMASLTIRAADETPEDISEDTSRANNKAY